eukprot:scaffold538828_cov15-Prasinocladus_malaysianus.AAC.1
MKYLPGSASMYMKLKLDMLFPTMELENLRWPSLVKVTTKNFAMLVHSSREKDPADSLTSR